MRGTAILVIYTGGTIGMKRDLETGSLVPFNFKQIQEEVPELSKFHFAINTISTILLLILLIFSPSFGKVLLRLLRQTTKSTMVL